MINPTAELYLEAVDVVLAMIADGGVSEAWTEPSSLPGMTVGGLTTHLALQVDRVLEVLTEDASGHEPIGVLRHYALVPWREQEPEGAFNAGIRQRAEDSAREGFEDTVARMREGRDRLARQLEDLDGEQPVFLPWTGWALTLDGLLITRLLELVVHGDDLAVSVGTDPLDFDDNATTSVIDLLSRLAVKRHGASALIRALSRAERAPASIAAI